MTEQLYLYRATIDNHDESFIEPELSVNYHKYLVVKETEHMYFIQMFNKVKRVNKYAVRRFARPTKDEALQDLKKRNNYYIRVLKTKLIYSQKIKEYLKDL